MRRRRLLWLLLTLLVEWSRATNVKVWIGLHSFAPSLFTLSRVLQQTYGIYGAIQFTSKTTTADSLMTQCFAGFALNGCQDLNTTAGYTKDYAFASQFTDPVKSSQAYCLQCCTKPVPTSGADETWNLSCPLNDLQRLSVSQGKRTIRFARRNTLDDTAIVQCAFPNRTYSTYLTGYLLTLFIIERSSNYGVDYWRSVVNCSVSISETTSPPSTFSEVIHIRSIPTAIGRPTSWILPAMLALSGCLVILSVPVYKGGIRGQRCQHCGSWLVFVNGMCCVCIAISCQCHPPTSKIYANNDSQQASPSKPGKG